MAYALAVAGPLVGASFAEAAPGDWSLSKTASPTTYTAPGQVINYTYVIKDNRGQGGTLASLTDTKVATVNCPTVIVPPGGTLTCTGSYTIAAADLTAGSVTNVATASGDSCNDGCLVTASASATVTFVGTPSWTLTKAASPTTYSASGQVITYSYVLSNTGPIAISNITLADTKVASVNCPATTLAPAAQMTCTGLYTVTPADVTAGSISNIATATGTPASGTLAPATAQATVLLVGTPSWTLSKTANPTTYSLPGQVITYTYVLKNAGPIAISKIALIDTKVTTVNCPATALAPGAQMVCTGLYTITMADVTATTVTNIATATGTPASGTLAPVTAQATITLDALQHRQQTLSLINQFLVYRLALLTQDDPDRVQYLRRVPGALWGEGDSSGGTTASTPLSFAGNSDDLSTHMSFSTSLMRIANAHEAVESPGDVSTAMGYARGTSAGAMPFKAPPKPAVKPESPFDIWIEGHFSQFKAQAADTSSSGSFGIVYAGADYMLTRSLMVGMLVQYDWTRDRSQQLLLPTSTIEGQGAMAGPYISGRLSPNLFFDARVAWGLSDNRINPLGTYQDSFATNRWLAHGNLVGNWLFGSFRFTPSAGVTYASERQLSYIDSLGITIPSQTVSLGRMSIGPEVAYRCFGANGFMYEPQFSLKGVWDFQRPDVPTVSGLVVSPDALHAKAEVALLAKAANGFSLRGAVAYDGLGSRNFHDVSGRLWLNFPLHQ